MISLFSLSFDKKEVGVIVPTSFVIGNLIWVDNSVFTLLSWCRLDFIRRPFRDSVIYTFEQSVFFSEQNLP